MSLFVKYEDLNKISNEFYMIFEPEDGEGDTNEKYKLREDLAKYVEHALYSYDVAIHDCKLTFKEWAIKKGVAFE